MIINFFRNGLIWELIDNQASSKITFTSKYIWCLRTFTCRSIKCTWFVFYQTYFGMDIDSVKDPLRRHALKTMVRTYGQTPKQLFRNAHPQRSSLQDTPTILSQLFTGSTPTAEVPVKQKPQLPYVVSPSPLPRCDSSNLHSRHYCLLLRKLLIISYMLKPWESSTIKLIGSELLFPCCCN